MKKVSKCAVHGKLFYGLEVCLACYTNITHEVEGLRNGNRILMDKLRVYEKALEKIMVDGCCSCDSVSGIAEEALEHKSEMKLEGK